MAKKNSAEWRNWNVRLWLNNDESLYRMAREYVRRNEGKRRLAALSILEDLHGMGLVRTPDGAQYTVASIQHAIEDM